MNFLPRKGRTMDEPTIAVYRYGDRYGHQHFFTGPARDFLRDNFDEPALAVALWECSVFGSARIGGGASPCFDIYPAIWRV